MSKIVKSLMLITPFISLSLGFFVYFKANYFTDQNSNTEKLQISFSPINPRVNQITVFEGNFNNKIYSRVQIIADGYLISKEPKGKFTYPVPEKWHLKYKGFDQPGQKKIKIRMFSNSDKKK